MTKRKAKTYEAEHKGRKTRVTVPPNTDAENDIADAMQDNFGPGSLAAIAAFLDAATTKNDEVNRQIAWFVEQLIKMVGGDAAMNRLCDEVGL
ncbi:MAG: hypothetical protein KAV00_13205 [Phycisphaerae bacterium]|nr:hypothetical protein [Phycisphaerae bacterium]